MAYALARAVAVVCVVFALGAELAEEGDRISSSSAEVGGGESPSRSLDGEDADEDEGDEEEEEEEEEEGKEENEEGEEESEEDEEEEDEEEEEEKESPAPAAPAPKESSPVAPQPAVAAPAPLPPAEAKSAAAPAPAAPQPAQAKSAPAPARSPSDAEADASLSSSPRNSSSPSPSSSASPSLSASPSPSPSSSPDQPDSPTERRPEPEATPVPPATRYTWTNCECLQSWEDAVGRCNTSCCNLDKDPDGDWCKVKDAACEDSDWGFCRPQSMSFEGCTDYPPDWKDSDGDDCATYAMANFCTTNGFEGKGWTKDFGKIQDYTADGYHAMAACCACGGGTFSGQGFNGMFCRDEEDWVDSDGDDCKMYSIKAWCRPDGKEGIGWHMEWGTLIEFGNKGLGAASACCACGGGGEGTDFPSTSVEDPWFGGWRSEGRQDDDTVGLRVPEGQMWAVASGACTIGTDNCLMSPNYPAKYQASQKCIIGVAENNAVPVSAVTLDTEWGYDTLKINAITYSGNLGPKRVVPSDSIVWTSDYEMTRTGFKICPDLSIPGAAQAGASAATQGGGALVKALIASMVLVVAVGVCCYLKRKSSAGSGLGDGVGRGYGRGGDV